MKIPLSNPSIGTSPSFIQAVILIVLYCIVEGVVIDTAEGDDKSRKCVLSTW